MVGDRQIFDAARAVIMARGIPIPFAQLDPFAEAGRRYIENGFEIQWFKQLAIMQDGTLATGERLIVTIPFEDEWQDGDVTEVNDEWETPNVFDCLLIPDIGQATYTLVPGPWIPYLIRLRESLEARISN